MPNVLTAIYAHLFLEPRNDGISHVKWYVFTSSSPALMFSG